MAAEVVLRSGSGAVPLDGIAETWLAEEIPGGATPESVLEAELPGGRRGTNFGYTLSSLWTRLEIRNAERTDADWVLVVEPPSVERVSLYAFDAGKRRVATFDFPGPRPGSGISARQPVFPLRITAGARSSVVVENRASRNLSFRLMPLSEFLRRESRDGLGMGLYYGFLLALLLHNVFLWSVMRETSQLHYLAFLASLGTLMGIMDGLLPWGHQLTGVVVLTIATASSFTRAFLETGRSDLLVERPLRALQFAGAALFVFIVAPFFDRPPSWVEYAGDLLIVAAVIMIVTAGARAARRGSRYARCFLLAWSGFLLAVCVHLAISYELISSGAASPAWVQVGSAFEMVVLSYALADRVRALKVQKVLAEGKASESEKLRKLVHLICHDLSNPLSVILAQSSLGERAGDKRWKLVNETARRQMLLIENVRMLEATRSGKIGIRIESVSLIEAVESACRALEHELRKKQVAVELQLELPRGADQILADPVLLAETVLCNLISNAIKFSHPDSAIRILARDSGSFVELAIEDRGIGIPGPLLDRIFLEEESTSRPGTLGERGTGFGLPLVKAVVEEMAAEIRVESRSREDGFDSTGTRFTLLFSRPAVSKESAS